MSVIKISNLMEVPLVALICVLLSNANREIHYPTPIVDQWMRSNQPSHDSPSGRTSPPQPPEPSLSSLSDRVNYQDPVGYPFEDFHNGVGSQSIEKLRQQRKTSLTI